MKEPNLLIINSDSHNKYERRSHGIRISGISGVFEMLAAPRPCCTVALLVRICVFVLNNNDVRSGIFRPDGDESPTGVLLITQKTSK